MTTLPHDTLLTRADVAREIGKHVSTVRRLEQKSVLTPVVGPDGVHRFRHDDFARGGAGEVGPRQRHCPKCRTSCQELSPIHHDLPFVQCPRQARA